jgi:carboxypeptidase D
LDSSSYFAENRKRANMALRGPSLAGWMRLPAIVSVLALSCLTSFAAADGAAGEYFVHSLPGAPEGSPLVKMHAG